LKASRLYSLILYSHIISTICQEFKANTAPLSNSTHLQGQDTHCEICTWFLANNGHCDILF